jgi:hypothetical protein
MAKNNVGLWVHHIKLFLLSACIWRYTLTSYSCQEEIAAGQQVLQWCCSFYSPDKMT